MKALLSAASAALFGLASVAMGGTAFYNGVLTAASPTFHQTNQSTVGSGVQHYSVQAFTVDLAGSYTFESASPNATGTPSSALDTFLILYTGSFNPATPNTQTAFNDDFTGTFTVLPGPFAPLVGPAGTGFTGTQPASRLLNIPLTTGVTYFLVNSSFRDTTFVGTGTTSQPRGAFFTGIGGPGNVNIVPEPASLGLLAIAAPALLRRRRA